MLLKARLKLKHHSECRREICSDVVDRDTTPFFAAKQIENRGHLLVPCSSAQRLVAESITEKSEHGIRKDQRASRDKRVAEHSPNTAKDERCVEDIYTEVSHLLGTHEVTGEARTAVLGYGAARHGKFSAFRHNNMYRPLHSHFVCFGLTESPLANSQKPTAPV